MENAEISAGFKRVFWGVTESQHLVDFINQHDYVDGIESDDRLGQPMISFELFTNLGDLEFYALPFFRERTYPGEDGNLRGEAVVSASVVEYESSSRSRHVDLALRWSHSLAGISYSLGYFSGTDRQPLLMEVQQSNETVLTPHYELVNRVSLELQVIREHWIANIETLAHNSQNSDHFSFVTGLERSYTSITGAADLRTVIEFHFDSRGDQTPQNYYNSPIRFQNDLFLGARLFLNDFQSSEFTIGAFVDFESAELAPFVETSRRIINNYTLDFTFKGFLSLELARHF